MPYLDETDEGWAKVQKRMAEALEAFAADLGPRVCGHGDWSDCEDCEFNETQPKPGTMPTIKSWVIVATVDDVTGDDSIISSVAAPDQRNHETKGLLHVGLYE
jgi:hypothetical protein